MSDTWLVTVNQDHSAHPVAWGIFTNPADMTDNLFSAGITGLADQIQLRNPDGSMASLILNDTHASATITRMPEDVARTVTDLDAPLWDVPDSLDGIPGFELPHTDDTESE